MGDTPVATGMADVITKLTTALTPEKFFTVVADLVPFIAILVPVALGVYFLRKLVKGAGKAKVRMQYCWGKVITFPFALIKKIKKKGRDFMFDVAINFMLELVDFIVPVFGIYILFDLIGSLLFNRQ